LARNKSSCRPPSLGYQYLRIVLSIRSACGRWSTRPAFASHCVVTIVGFFASSVTSSRTRGEDRKVQLHMGLSEVLTAFELARSRVFVSRFSPRSVPHGNSVIDGTNRLFSSHEKPCGHKAASICLTAFVKLIMALYIDRGGLVQLGVP
jgi:hypothetical protein